MELYFTFAFHAVLEVNPPDVSPSVYGQGFVVGTDLAVEGLTVRRRSRSRRQGRETLLQLLERHRPLRRRQTIRQSLQQLVGHGRGQGELQTGIQTGEGQSISQSLQQLVRQWWSRGELQTGVQAGGALQPDLLERHCFTSTEGCDFQ